MILQTYANIERFLFNYRFCVGDRFYLCDNKILCEYDYEERLVFANMAYNPSSLAHIRRQVSNLQVGPVNVLVCICLRHKIDFLLPEAKRSSSPMIT